MVAKSARNKLWKVYDTPARNLADSLGCSDSIAALFYHRLGRASDLDRAESPALDHLRKDIDEFLNARYPQGVHDPLSLKGMPEASQRIAQAIRQGERMAVYGDFDTDGVTAVTLLMQAIPALGGSIEPYIPHREREGYGLNIQAIEYLADQGIKLLITVDCGITNVAEVEHASTCGLDVIITDHHRPPAILPPAYAIVNPKQADCPYPYEQLVGVGIAFKLVQALVKQGLRLNNLRGRDMLDVVALGTVADMAPLTGENRVLVRAGIEALRQTRRPGLRALIKAAGLKQEMVDSLAIGFMLGPRINAAGRLDDAILAYDLLLAQDMDTARQIASQLNGANRQRQELTRQVFEQALIQAEQSGQDGQRIVVLHNEDYPAGIVGLVAGKLVEHLARPVILIAQGEEISRGSARSVPTFNIFQALTTCKDTFSQDYPGKELFIRFGGHSMAAGFTIANEHISELTQRLQRLADEHLTDDLLQPTIFIDVEVPLEQISWSFLEELTQFEPFGQANPQPILHSSNVQVLGVWPRGSDGRHLKLHLGKDATAVPLEAIAFGLGDHIEMLQQLPRIDVVYTLEANTWNGRRSLQLNVKDFRYV
jgi:single-stranded-DNA-specific exonuclease